MTRRGRPKRRADEDEIPEVYRELLAEAEAEASASASHASDEGRIRKRRRVGNRGADQQPLDKPSIKPEGLVQDQTKAPSSRQAAVTEPESSEESDVGWEDVELAQEQVSEEDLDTDGLDIVLDEKELGRQRTPRSKNIVSTAAQRRLRLAIHKMHLLCLLVHAQLRNRWCNDSEVQAALRPLLPARTISYLNPNPSFSQFQSSRSFMDGLSQASEIWRGKFMKSARGLRRAQWFSGVNDVDNLPLPNDFDAPLEKADFVQHARDLKASRDVGAQLFCALLRGVGVETRLVCSLQVLPFSAPATKGSTPQKPPTATFPIAAGNGTNDDTRHDMGLRASPGRVASDPDVSNSPRPLVPKVARRLGQPSFGAGSAGMDPGRAPVVEASKRKIIRESPYPVYWVEAFNAALQKWIPVDPLVTRTIAKPMKLEPPASDTENSMTYVMAFEDDSVARDVTRRYAKAVNAKTRKMRVESTPGGEEWWKGVLRFYDRRYALDRDQVENAELAAQEAQEPMPRNVQDFKDHPYYALERHLKRNEVIHPKTEIGKVAAGKSASDSASKTLEPIYRRRDVHVVRSADGWYRLGRDVKPGEQPLKRSAPRRSKKRLDRQDDESDASDEVAEKGLYAEFQTVPYEPPPIVNGRVPKNSYGNLDVFVPSMVPKGGVHIPYSEAAYAIRLLGVDYADAVTGFEFRGRSGTPVVRGIVTSADYRPAIEAVMQGIRDHDAEVEAVDSSVECLRMWKRFLLALRIHARIGNYDIEGDTGNLQTDLRMIEHDDAEAEEGGGFFMERGQSDFAEPTAGRFTAPTVHHRESFSEGGGGFLLDDDAEEALRESEKTGGTATMPSSTGQGHQVSPLVEASNRQNSTGPGHPYADVEPGGFFREADADTGGGFLPDSPVDNMDNPASPRGHSNPSGDDRVNLPDHESAGEAIETNVLTSTMQNEQPLALRDVPRLTAPPGDQGPRAAAAGRDQDGSSAAPGEAAPMERPSSRSEQPNPTDSQDDIKAGDNENKITSHNDDDDEWERSSLISHDPEDEDADPEWLMSD